MSIHNMYKISTACSTFLGHRCVRVSLSVPEGLCPVSVLSFPPCLPLCLEHGAALKAFRILWRHQRAQRSLPLVFFNQKAEGHICWSRGWPLSTSWKNPLEILGTVPYQGFLKPFKGVEWWVDSNISMTSSPLLSSFFWSNQTKTKHLPTLSSGYSVLRWAIVRKSKISPALPGFCCQHGWLSFQFHKS